MGTRGQWAIDFIAAMGNTNPSANTIKFVAAWTKGEGTTAKYNPLATTLDHGTNTNFNKVGVKNYSTRQEGIEASVLTLRGDFPGYKNLAYGIRTNDPEKSLSSGGLDTWGTGTAAVMAIYRSGDVRSEMLASEGESEGGGTAGASIIDGIISAVAGPTAAVAVSPITDSNNTQVEAAIAQAGPFTEELIISVWKQFVGWSFIAAGGIILIILAIKSDAAQQAAKTATNVAEVAAVAAA